ncbi:probable serine/threonine-protein kinase PBL26 [Morus notabilis]|uniref:probable serine/threonine-protein kinase PBL26 n=1 Tax=Morus notabilis TaxID=981085 RepID=UPI000CED5FE7|nr:probable serine/threonine-protein kinase PBL26 [Morus notabilis]
MESAAKGGRRSVVVILDASRDESLKAIERVWKEFSLESGDDLIILAVLHQVNSPMGYKVTVDYNSMFGTNEKVVEDALAVKEKEFMVKKEIISISNACQTEKISFQVMVLAGKIDAVEEAKVSEATWVILDKETKRDKKFFLERLSCDISRMKDDKSLEYLRGPKEKGNSKQPTEDFGGPKERGDSNPPTEGSTRLQTDTSTRGHIKYDEMIPGSPKGKHSHHRSSSGSKEKSSIDKENTRSTEGERAERSENDGGSPEGHGQNLNDYDWIGGYETDEEFISTCTKCDNRRPKTGWKKEFTYKELNVATSCFSDKNFLSEGGFGSVYKGVLKNGLNIAVKQHKSASFQGEKEFEAEVHFLSKARHENLVVLLGSCSEGDNRLLVYEFVCNRSLDQHLSKHTREPLSWNERMKIATGAAKGLQYLHAKNIVHRDIRPNNILLTHDHHTLLGDFGLARTQEEDHSSVTRVVGTLGYLAPEYAESGKVSTKTDVYSFGVILLQLITGRGTNDKSLEGRSLVGWARPLLKERNYPDLIDSRITDSHDVHQLFWMIRVAEKCLTKDPKKRLSMDEVVYALNYLRESDTICNIRLSPANSDSSPGNGRDSPDTNVDDDDNDHAKYDLKTPTMYSTRYYDHNMSGTSSQSYSTRSISSSESSSMFTASVVSSLDNRDYLQ